MNHGLTLTYETEVAGRRGEPGGRRRRNERVMPGPDAGRARPSGLAGPAFEAEVYRLRSEGLSLRPLSAE
jgi:hypothetical protein